MGLLTAELGSTPLIGFAGAPFTVASYLVEGGPSRNHERTKAMMYGEPELWADLLDRLADITAAFLKVQIAAGASAVQLFDSWAGALAPDDYRRYVMPASAKVFDAVAGYGVPRIHFGVGTGELLGLMAQAGADVVGVDWRVPLDEAVAPGRPGQGAAGQPRSRGAVRPPSGRRGQGPRGAVRRAGRPRSHLQPRPRRAAGHRPGRPHPARGLRPHDLPDGRVPYRLNTVTQWTT